MSKDEKQTKKIRLLREIYEELRSLEKQGTNSKLSGQSR